MFRVLLCIPPDYDYNFPTLGTPALCGFLKKKGIDVIQIDLNLGYRDFLITHIQSSQLTYAQKKSLLKICLKKLFSEKLKDRYYSHFLPSDNNETSLELAYDNNTNSSFFFTENLLSSEYLWQYLEDEDENTFYQFYKQKDILGFLEKKEIKLLGISIISPSQAIASLTLGFLVKKYLPHIHISIGGQWPTLYRKVLLERKDLFNCFDSIIVFEGETPLYRLVEALKDKKDTFIPNVIFKNTKTDFSNNHTEENLNELPCPDFDGLFLDEYEGKDMDLITLTFETSRGCYWSKCAYCVDLPLPKPTYRRKTPILVVRDIKELKQKYNVGHLMLSDPGVSPRQMLEVAKEILKQRIEISWWCMARLDPGFNYDLFKIAKEAGLKQINFGFETANERLCKLLDKGYRKESTLRIIKDCHKAGIKVGLQTMLGLPQETFEEGLETVDFLIRNKGFIEDVIFNTYYLTPENFIYRNPKKYGIEYAETRCLPFTFFIPFRNIQGMSMQQAVNLENIYWLLLGKDKSKNRKSIFSLEKKFSLAKDVSEGFLEFSLNRESVRIDYLYNRLNQSCLWLKDYEKEILDLIKKGLSLKEVYAGLSLKYSQDGFLEKLSFFIEEAYREKFLIKK